MNLSRRRFLGGLTCGALGLNVLSPLFWQRELLAGQPDNNKKLIFIFQRGGNDGINTLIPRGDPDYNTVHRPSLFIPEAQALDTGNGFAQLHPRLQPMLEIFNHASLNGQPGPGNLAILHRIGYRDQSRSHFDSQHFWETGVPGEPQVEEGMIFRHVNETLDLGQQENAFVAAGLSHSQLLALKGPQPIPNFRRATDFTFRGTQAASAKFLGQPPSTPGAGDGKGLLGLYDEMPNPHAKPYRQLVTRTGQLLGSTMSILKEAVAAGSYTPVNGAVYPGGSFGQRLQEAAMLLKRTSVKVVGLNIGGWDTHAGQGQIYGRQGNLLADLALGFQALYRDLQDQWEDLLVVTMTEFGRTTVENAGRGTDHAEATLIFAAGGGVNGGVYNCDSDSWKSGDMFAIKNRYLSHRTDFRAVFAEIFSRHFGDSGQALEQIIPGFSEAAASDPASFASLNFLR